MPRRRAEVRGAYATPADRTMATMAPPPRGPAGVAFKRYEPVERPSPKLCEDSISQKAIDIEALAGAINIEGLAEAIFRRIEERIVPQARLEQELKPEINELLQKIGQLRHWVDEVVSDQSRQAENSWQPFLTITEMFLRTVEAAIMRAPALEWLLPIVVSEESMEDFRAGLTDGDLASSRKLLEMARQNIEQFDKITKQDRGRGSIWVKADQRPAIYWEPARILKFSNPPKPVG